MYGATPRYFTVEGRGDVPMDMLRKDQCWPVGMEDATNMLAIHAPGGRVRRRVRLASLRLGSPTLANWEVHGWRVVEQDI